MKLFRLFTTPFEMINKRYQSTCFHLMDYIVISYIIFLGFLVIPFHYDHYLQTNVPNWWQYPILHSIIAILLMELIRLSYLRPNKIIHFIRTFYPAILLSPAWSELDHLVTIILPYWANDFVINLDLFLFSVHPTVWVEKLFTPWLTELMNFFYLSYFLFIPISALTLYFKGKKEKTLDLLFLTFLTYTTAFLLFLVFPSEGAWITLKSLHTIEHEGGFFMNIVQNMQAQGTIRGGAFPSSHVSAAFTIVWANMKYQKKLGWVLLPIAIGVAISTIYLRYHHAVDAISGLIWGSLMYGAGIFILKKWQEKIDYNS